MEIERVIREVTVRGQVQNMDQVARAYDQVSAASDRNVIAFEKNARAVQSVDRELERMRLRYQDGYREQQKYIEAHEVYRRAVEQGRLTQAAAAAELQNVRDRLEDTTRAQQEMTRAANDNARSMQISGDEILSVAGHLKTAAFAAYVLSPAFRGLVNPVIVTGLRATGSALSVLSPTIAAVATNIGARLLPALSLVGRISIPIAVFMEAVRAWQLGAQELERLVKIASDAAKLDVTTNFFQRSTKAAEDFRLKASDVEETLKRFKQVSESKLGGSVFDQEVDKLVKWGNFANNGGVAAYRQAVTTEEKYRAAVQLVTTAIQQGERLAGLELASKFVSPETLEGLKANGELLAEMQRKADAIKPVDLVSQEQIARAVNLEQRYNAAVKLLETRWQPIQDALTAGGIRMHEIWVGVVEMVARAFDGIVKLIEKAASALEPITAALSKLPSWVYAGAAAAIPGVGAVAGAAVTLNATSPTSQASPYKSWAADAVATQNAMRNVYEFTSKVRQDTSKGPPPTAEAKDALDRARESVEKYIQVTDAQAKTVGQSVFEQEKAKKIAELTAAAFRDGTKVTAELSAEFEELGNRAGNAARNLRLTQVNDQIKFDRQTLDMGLSPEDVQIAQQLRGLYPDIATALNSAQAAQIRFNNNLRAGREIVSGFGNELVSGLLRGEGAMKSLTAAASSLIQRLASQNISRLLNGGSLFGSQSLGSTAGLVGMAGAGLAGYQSGSWSTGLLGGALAGASFGPAGAVAGGILGALGGLFGGNSQRREQERQRLLEEQQRQQQEQQRQEQEAQALAFRSASIGLDTSTRSGSLADLSNRQAQEVAQAVANGSRNILQLQEVHRREMEQLNSEWDKREEEIERQKREAAAQRLAGYEDRYFAAKIAGDQSLNAQLLAFDRSAQRQREDEQKAGNENIVQLEQTLAEERAQIEKRYQEEIAKRQQSYEDRLFQATNDQATLSGKLAAYDRQALREREEEWKKGGEAINELVRAQEAERAKIIRDYYVELSNYLKGVVKSIGDYLRNLRQGDSSTLSASEKLSLSQSQFNQRYALAQSGNRDALSDITNYAQTYLQNARSYYASSASYAAIFNQVTSMLETLSSTLTTSTINDADKIVQSIDNNTSSTNSTTQTTSTQEQNILSTMTSLLSTTTGLLSSSNNLLSSSNSVLGAINSLTAGQNNTTDRLINALNGLGSIFSLIGNTHTSILSDINKNTFRTAWGGSTGSSWTLWNWLGFQRGGLVPGFADGGLVTNGQRGVDSVLARYGNGYAYLAGGEFVMPEPQTRANLPFLEAMRQGRLPAAGNDNGDSNFVELGRLLAAQNAKLDRVAALLEQLIGSTEDGSKKLAGALAVKKALPR